MTNFFALLAETPLIVSSACLAMAASLIFRSLQAASSDLEKLNRARTVSLSDLSSLMSGELVLVRGFVRAPLDYLELESSTGVPCVILKKTFARTVSIKLTSLGWILDIPDPYVWTKYVPYFILAGGESNNTGRRSECQVIVNMGDSSKIYSLTTVFSALKFDFTHCYALLKSLVGIRLIPQPPNFAPPEVGESVVLQEEILPVGDVVSVIGICSPPSQENASLGLLGMTKDIIKINHCPGFRYFVSEMTKDEMMEELSRKSDKLFWTGVVFGSLSVGLLGYVIFKWKRKLQGQRSG